MAPTIDPEHLVFVAVTTNLETQLLFGAPSNTAIGALRRRVEQQHAETPAHVHRYGQVSCNTISVAVGTLPGRFTLADSDRLSSVESQQGSDSVGVFAELRQVSSLAAQTSQAEAQEGVVPSVQHTSQEQLLAAPIQQPASQQPAREAVQASEHALVDLAATTAQLHPTAMAGQPPDQQKYGQATSDEQQRAVEPADAEGSKKGKKAKREKKEQEKKRKKQSEDAVEAAEGSASGAAATGGPSTAAQHNIPPAVTLIAEEAPAAGPSTRAGAAAVDAAPADRAASSDPSGPPVKKRKEKHTPAESGAQHKQKEEEEEEKKGEEKKQKEKKKEKEEKKKKRKARKAAQHRAATAPDAAEGNTLNISLPAEPGEPPAHEDAQTAGLTSLTAAHVPAKAAEEDALPTGTEAMRKKNKQDPDNQAAAVEQAPASDPRSSAMPVINPEMKKKRKNRSKAATSSKVPGIQVPVDGARASGDGVSHDAHAHALKQEVSAPSSGPHLTAEAAPTPALGPAAGQASSAAPGQAGFGPADNQVGPSASAVDQEKAVLPKGNRRTSKSGGEGAAAGERGESKAEKSKSRKPAKAKLEAETTAAKGKSIGPAARGKSSGSAATSGTPVPKPVPGASPPKVQQGQWKTKPTAVVSGVGTPKEAMAGAGADALALMPHIPTAPATAPSEAGAASASASHHADAAPAAQGISTLTAKALDMHQGRAAAGLPPAATVPDPSSSSSSSDEEDAGGTQVNADTLPPAIAGSCEPPSTTSSGSSSGEEEVQPTQVAGAVHDDEDAGRVQQLDEEARKRKQARCCTPAAPKPQDEHAAQLAELTANVRQQEQQLRRTRNMQLKAKHRLLLTRKRANEVVSSRQAEPVPVPPAEPTVMVDPSISASKAIWDAVNARDTLLRLEPEGDHEKVLGLISRCAEDLVTSATAKLLRCSESAVKATSCSPPYSPCPYPSSSRVATPPISQPAATLPVVRPALERALLQSNRRFWDENPTAEDKMADQCPRRRSRQAMQLFLRLHILVACKEDIPLERHPAVIIPIGAFWDGLADFWSDLVHELPNIPVGANEYFATHLKPALGAKIPVAIKMIGRNCGLWTEDDLLLEPEGLGGAVLGDSCCHAPSASSMPTSRRSGSSARRAVPDRSRGARRGTRHSAAAASLKAGPGIAAKALPRPRRQLTGQLGGGFGITWKPSAAVKGKASMAGGRAGRQGQPNKLETPHVKPIRASDMEVSPSCTEDSDAIPATEPHGQRAVNSGGLKDCARALAFGNIPTMQELELRSSRDDDAFSAFGEHDATAADAASEEVSKPVARGWMQNAARKAPFRFGGRQMAPGPSKVLPPAGRSTLLSQLQTALSPQSFPASTAAAAAEAACPVVSPEVSAECTAQAQPDLPKGADDALQDRSTSAFTLGANVQANKQVPDRKRRHKLTMRKRVNPCMMSQPLASAHPADTGAQAHCLA